MIDKNEEELSLDQHDLALLHKLEVPVTDDSYKYLYTSSNGKYGKVKSIHSLARDLKVFPEERGGEREKERELENGRQNDQRNG